MGSPYEIALLRCNCHMRSLGYLCVLVILAQYSMNPYVYSTGLGRCPFGCSADPYRRRTGFGTTYGQYCRPVWGKYRVCRTHRYGPLLDHARHSTGPKSSEAYLKAVHAQLSATGYTDTYGSKNHRKIVQTRSAVIRPVVSGFSLCA